MIPNDLILNAIFKDGFPEEGVMHENITRLIDNIDLVPSLKLNVIIDAVYKWRKDVDRCESAITSMSSIPLVYSTVPMLSHYSVTAATITLMAEWTNSTSHQTPFCRRYYTNFSDFANVEEYNSYEDAVHESVYVIRQLIYNLINPVSIDAKLDLTDHNYRLNALNAKTVQFFMTDYYYNYYTLLKPVDILFENEDNENIPKTIRTFVPNVKSHGTMMFPYLITKYLIDHDHPECIRYLGLDIVDDLIDFCTEVDINVVPYLIEHCERSTIQDRFKL